MKLLENGLRGLFATVMVLLVCWLANAAEQGAAEEPGELYLPSENAADDVADATERARESGKLVLVVLGANWCHDSRALASRLYQQPLKAVVDENYELVLVDVGFLENGGDVISSIGPPVYYATPTVLIVDPLDGRLVNDGNRHQWGGAYDISMEDSLDYFKKMAAPDQPAAKSSTAPDSQLQELLAGIDSFERLQADRLYEYYSVLGPLLKAHKDGQTPQGFEELWNEVREFRMQVPLDVERLRADAFRRTAEGERNIELVYPDYD